MFSNLEACLRDSGNYYWQTISFTNWTRPVFTDGNRIWFSVNPATSSLYLDIWCPCLSVVIATLPCLYEHWQPPDLCVGHSPAKLYMYFIFKKQKKEKQFSQMIQSQGFKNYIEKYIIYDKMYIRVYRKVICSLKN